MTTRIIPLFGLALLLTVPAFSHAEDKAAEEADKKESEVKTVEVELKGGLKLNVPESWKQSKPSSRLRLAQFDIPAAKGDEEGGELAVFNFGFGGGAKANIERWIGQFQADDREVSVKEGAIEAGRYFFVEISGTYNKPIGPPIAQRTKAAPGSRMLGVMLGVEDKGIYFLKMTGPDKTVSKQAQALRASFSADAKKEKDVKLDELR